MHGKPNEFQIIQLITLWKVYVSLHVPSACAYADFPSFEDFLAVLDAETFHREHIGTAGLPHIHPPHQRHLASVNEPPGGQYGHSLFLWELSSYQVWRQQGQC